MAKPQIRRDETPIRLFDSDFLEFFTHISPIAVLAIWLPVVGFFIYRSIWIEGSPWFFLPLGLLGGLFLWTFAEYILHRFLFHFPAKNKWQERVAFLFHGIHHEQPRVKTRLVMPPAVSIPLALVFFGLFYLIFSVLLNVPAWISPIFSVFVVGNIIYDMMDYITHNFLMRKGYFRMVRQQHMHHHFQTPNQRFGVSSPLWDYVFGTMPQG